MSFTKKTEVFTQIKEVNFLLIRLLIRKLPLRPLLLTHLGVILEIHQHMQNILLD